MKKQPAEKQLGFEDETDKQKLRVEIIWENQMVTEFKYFISKELTE